MGGQGVGKGSLAKRLMEKYGFVHVEAGAILRSMPQESEIYKIITSGNLVPDNMLFDIMVEEAESMSSRNPVDYSKEKEAIARVIKMLDDLDKK